MAQDFKITLQSATQNFKFKFKISEFWFERVNAFGRPTSVLAASIRTK